MMGLSTCITGHIVTVLHCRNCSVVLFNQDFKHYLLLWLDYNVPFSTLLDSALVQVEAGNRALKTVFGSKIAAKGKSLTELLQPHSTGNCSVTFLFFFYQHYIFSCSFMKVE